MCVLIPQVYFQQNKKGRGQEGKKCHTKTKADTTSKYCCLLYIEKAKR